MAKRLACAATLDSASRYLPVFDQQSRRSTEFCCIVGSQSQAVGERDRCDHGVVGTDRRSLICQKGAQPTVFLGGDGVEGKRPELLAQLIDAQQICSAVDGPRSLGAKD